MMFGLYARIGVPDSVLDLGCGIGVIVHLSAKLGIPSFGFEIMLKEEEHFGLGHLFPADLSKPLPIFLDPFDLVTCLEVVEHIPPSGADQVVNTMVSHTKNRLVLSAATKGQGGSGHVNEQPHEYWIDKIQPRLKYSEKESDIVREIWEATKIVPGYYCRNVMIFKRK
jgi:SAM-dependent methyltransferase